MTSSQRAKGNKAEREAASLLHELTGCPVRRRLQEGRADDAGDLEGLPDCCVQVKNYRDTGAAIRDALASLEEQRANAGATFAAAFVRRPGGRFMVVMQPEHFATLYREAVQA